jgi:hypothetical protein
LFAPAVAARSCRGIGGRARLAAAAAAVVAASAATCPNVKADGRHTLEGAALLQLLLRLAGARRPVVRVCVCVCVCANVCECVLVQCTCMPVLREDPSCHAYTGAVPHVKSLGCKAKSIFPPII